MALYFTQIGSLPYDNVEDAVRYSLKYAEKRNGIPFFPELPLIPGDSMDEYIKNPGRMSCLEEFKKHEYDKVKIQCVGPATLMCFPYSYSEDAALNISYQHIESIMDGLIAKEVILFLDEPSLRWADFDFYPAWDALFASFNVVPGVHTCQNIDWDRMFAADIDIISFDASSFGTKLTMSPKYRSGKRIAWGIENLLDIQDCQLGDLVTMPCGMSDVKYTVDDCERIYKIWNDIFKEPKSLNPS